MVKLLNVLNKIWLGLSVLLVGMGSVMSEAADGIWSDFKIIDIHGHCGTFAGYDLSEATLLANMKSYGVTRALISNIDGADMPGVTGCLSQNSANGECARIVGKHPQLLRGLLWCRPTDGKAESLRRFINMGRPGNPIFVGLKLHPEMNHFPADSGIVDPYMEICKEFGLPACFHCGADSSESSPERIYTLARRFPKVPVVLYHMGFGASHKQAIAVCKQAMTKKDADIYLETAQCSPEAVLEAIATVGADRVIFGTDATYFGKRHYSHYENLVATLKAKLKDTDFQKVVNGNAKRIFHGLI